VKYELLSGGLFDVGGLAIGTDSPGVPWRLMTVAIIKHFSFGALLDLGVWLVEPV
jgi:hypothetical protein